MSHRNWAGICRPVANMQHLTSSGSGPHHFTLCSIVLLVICQQLHSFISLSSLSSDPSWAVAEGGRCACEARAVEPRFVLGQTKSAICGEGLAVAPTSESHWMVELLPHLCLSRAVLSPSKSPAAWRAEMSSTRRPVTVHKAHSTLNPLCVPNVW